MAMMTISKLRVQYVERQMEKLIWDFFPSPIPASCLLFYFFPALQFKVGNSVSSCVRNILLYLTKNNWKPTMTSNVSVSRNDNLVVQLIWVKQCISTVCTYSIQYYEFELQSRMECAFFLNKLFHRSA